MTPDTGQFREVETNNLLIDRRLTGTAAKPSIRFGDGDTGFYENTDDSVLLVSAGSGYAMRWNGAGANVNQTNGAMMRNVDSTATAPAFAFVSDTDTGIGWAGADECALVAGAKQGLTAQEGLLGTVGTHAFIPNTTTAPTSNPTGGGVMYVSGGALYFRGSSGTVTTLGLA